MTRPRRILLLLAASAAVLLVAPAAHAASAFQASKNPPPVFDPKPPAGAQVLKYRFGPMKIRPGQNTIDVDIQKQRPNVDGWIVGFRPGLIDADTGKSPSVDVVHLHHAVWLVDLQPTFAAGEEKTYFNAPAGYGWRYTTRQTWLLNHMIHDLAGSPHRVYITYTLWFIPDTAPEAQGMREIRTQWMDVQGVKPYPVFDALRGQGTKGRFTYPDQARDPYPDGRVRNRWVVDRDATLVATAGHLHPGGLWTDLELTRDGRTVRLFRSRANYFEPAGSVSWDVAMTATGPRWRVAVEKGDVLSTSATYDTSRASWYEVMGIMVVGITNAPDGGVDPFTGKVDQRGYLTHGRLPENIERGVGRRTAGYVNPLRLRQGPFRDRVTIKDFAYRQGDLSARGRAGLPPSVRQGRRLTFVNADTPLTVRYHTVTACRAPCNRTAGIRFPLADGRRTFDSGELGYGLAIATLGLYAGGDARVPGSPVVDRPAPDAACAKGGPGELARIVGRGCIGRTAWQTPRDLGPGLYTYYCRIHPFMRGAFRVVPDRQVEG
ncbi:MAG TPA: hypothetical protein VLA98_14320 [Solirubrobacteraceae bacterium]|nr:hypothetical protein [Solirubrobacteraceae bacterium]